MSGMKWATSRIASERSTNGPTPRTGDAVASNVGPARDGRLFGGQRSTPVLPRSYRAGASWSGGTLSSERRSPNQTSVSLVTEPRAGASQAVPRQIAPLAVVVRAALRPPNTGRHDGLTLSDALARRSLAIVPLAVPA